MLLLYLITQIIFYVSIINSSKPNIIKLGKYTILICGFETGNTDILNGNRIWFKNTDTLSINDLIFDNSKEYESVVTKNKLLLMIKDFTKKDLSFRYLCAYTHKINNFIFSYVFPKLKQSMIFNPITKNNINVNFDHSIKNLLITRIHFKKIFPEPKCVITINDKLIKQILYVNTNYVDDFFFNITLTINHEITKCIKDVNVKCEILNEVFIIEVNKNLLCPINIPDPKIIPKIKSYYFLILLFITIIMFIYK